MADRYTEKRDGQNAMPLRQDGKTKWALLSAGMGDASTQFLYGEQADILAAYEDTGMTPEDIKETQEAVTPIPFSRFREIMEAERDGRCVILPKPEEADYDGLKVKYRVFKAKDNTPVENCFVLRPDKDEAALYALMCYGMATDNLLLGRDVLAWVSAIDAAQEAEAAMAKEEKA